jgi:hypothetical protein
MCSISPEDVEKIWAGRWNKSPNFDYEQIDQLFPIHQVFTHQKNERIIIQQFDLEAMVRLIFKIGNPSGPNLSNITFPFLQLEKESASR